MEGRPPTARVKTSISRHWLMTLLTPLCSSAWQFLAVQRNNSLCRAAQVLGLPTTAHMTPRCQPLSPELQLNPLKVRKKLTWKSHHLQDTKCGYHSPSHTNIHTYLLPVNSNNKNWSGLQKFCCTIRLQMANGKRWHPEHTMILWKRSK